MPAPKILLFFSALLFAPVAMAETVGVITQTSGEARMLRGENYLEAEVGVEIEAQDIIETEADSSAQVDMEDGSVLKLGPESRLALSEYRLDSNKGVLAAGVDLLSGWLRFAVAKLKKDSSYAIRTPVLTVGVRGTEGTIEAQNEQSGLHLESGEVEVVADAEGGKLAPVRVSGGEYIRRLRGQSFDKFPQPPPAFVNRLPPVVQQKLARQTLDARQRGISPRIIRAITQDDAQKLLQRHPHMNQRLHQRFSPATKSEADSEGKPRHERRESRKSDHAPSREGAGKESLKMSPTIREAPRQGPGESLWLKRVPPAAGSSPLQHVPALQGGQSPSGPRAAPNMPPHNNPPPNRMQPNAPPARFGGRHFAPGAGARSR